METLSQREREGFAAITPDFVVELRSPSDSWRLLEEKMLDYIRNGVQLGWLIDPQSKRVHVHRPAHPVVTLQNPDALKADPILPGFVFNPQEIW